MQTLYMQQKIKDLEKEVNQTRNIISLIINLLSRYEGGSELLEKIREMDEMPRPIK